MSYYKPKKRRKSSGNTASMIAGVLVALLIIGLLGSMFNRSAGSADPDTDETQTPTTSVTDPTEASTESPTEAPEMITFSIMGSTFQVESGTTFQEWLDSAPDFEDEVWYVTNSGIVDCDRGFGGIYLSTDVNIGSEIKGTDVIVSGGSYSPM